MEPRERIELRRFLRQVFFRGSVRGWRDVRASKWEIVVVAVWTAVIVYAVLAVLTTAIDTGCLWNRSGPKCEGGWGR